MPAKKKAPPTTRKFLFRIPNDLYRAISLEALDLETSRSKLIVEALLARFEDLIKPAQPEQRSTKNGSKKKGKPEVQTHDIGTSE